MSEEKTFSQIQCLEKLLNEWAPVHIALSGGVDSMTLAIVAGRCLQKQATMFHAVSPAVPPIATDRVKQFARMEQWDLRLVQAGEFDDEEYLRNPYTRCFHCKKNLYGVLTTGSSDATVLSGTNRDDMADFRPGLQAATKFSVRHPYVECGIDKEAIRRICAMLGYQELAQLPASPCLSSRVQTGIRIDAEVLGFVDRIETALREAMRPQAIRCRIRATEIAVELDAASLNRLTQADVNSWRQHIASLADDLDLPIEVRFEHYRMGSAFVGGV